MSKVMGEFEVGEVVCLASEGGPEMTVTGEGPIEGAAEGVTGVLCTWFNDKGEVQTKAFPADALRHFIASSEASGLELK